MEDPFWFARNKVVPFLYDLHAIRYPAQHPLEMQVSGPLLDDGWVQIPEAALCDSRLSEVQKALYVKQDFGPIGRAVVELSPRSRVHGITDFCVQNTVSWDLDLLKDDDGDVLTVEQLLPPDEVVAAMVGAWGEHNAPRCPSLEAFIAEHTFPLNV